MDVGVYATAGASASFAATLATRTASRSFDHLANRVVIVGASFDVNS